MCCDTDIPDFASPNCGDLEATDFTVREAAVDDTRFIKYRATDDDGEYELHGVVPGRVGATRIPDKVLENLADSLVGKPLTATRETVDDLFGEKI